MARPRKKGLDYFPMDVDLFYNIRIFDLMLKYGTSGLAVYLSLITRIYRSGYYLELPVSQLASMIIRDVGGKWLRSSEYVVQILDYCAQLGLLNRELYQRGVFTSEGIQRRYEVVTARSKACREYYWLLPVNEAKTCVSDEETQACDSETAISDDGIDIKKIKENYIKAKQIKAKQSGAAHSGYSGKDYRRWDPNAHMCPSMNEISDEEAEELMDDWY